MRYVWWNWFYAVMEFFNRALARDPNRKVSWDKWPPAIGLMYLLAKLRFNRSNALTDPYDYESNDNDGIVAHHLRLALSCRDDIRFPSQRDPTGATPLSQQLLNFFPQPRLVGGRFVGL